MPAPSNPAVLAASSGRSPAGQADLRVSDAERAEIADQLARHYGEGRLDSEEFGQRLDLAMAARTYRDLAGLLRDMPHPDAAAGAVRPTRRQRPPRGQGRWHRLRGLALFVLLAIALVASVCAVSWALVPVLWAGALVAIMILAIRRRSRRR
jgi:Flp pilus assembly protein TadB